MKSGEHKSSPKAFENNMLKIVQILKTQTSAKIILSSLAPIGENFSNPGEKQKLLNESIILHSNTIKKLSETNHVGYLPLFEVMSKEIINNPGKSLEQVKICSMYRDAFRSLILGWSPDEIAKSNGWNYHSDGIHLNSKEAQILIDLIKLNLNL